MAKIEDLDTAKKLVVCNNKLSAIIKICNNNIKHFCEQRKGNGLESDENNVLLPLSVSGTEVTVIAKDLIKFLEDQQAKNNKTLNDMGFE